jgi:hypothetical protein
VSKIYIGGDLLLCAKYIDELPGLGHVSTRDYWSITARAISCRERRPTSAKDRTQWSADDLRGVESADIVWMLLLTTPLVGCAFEAGYAAGRGRNVIMSGDWRSTIFSAETLACFDKHQHALEWLRLYGMKGDREEEMAALEGQMQPF